jgi:hypothetical protein
MGGVVSWRIMETNDVSRRSFPRVVAFLVGVGLMAPLAHAETLQISPLASYRSGGSFSLATSGLVVRPDPTLALGGTLDLVVAPTWRVELAYSRQDTKMDGPYGARLGLAIENYFVGLQEERGADQDAKTRPFGTLLVGATRFVPDFAANSKTEPAVGLALGFKYLPTRNLGLRFEGRGIMTFTNSTGAVLCGGNGTCFFNSSGSTFWQWEALGGLILAF